MAASAPSNERARLINARMTATPTAVPLPTATEVPRPTLAVPTAAAVVPTEAPVAAPQAGRAGAPIEPWLIMIGAGFLSAIGAALALRRRGR